MSAAWRKAWAFLTTYYAYMLAYRAELVLWALANSLPFILMGAWMKAAEHGELGKTPADLARYFLAAFIVRQVTVVWVIWEFEHDVVKGQLSNQLLMPIDPVWRHLLSHVAERFARMPFSFLIVLLVFALYPKAFWVPSLKAVCLAFTFMVLALLLRFVMQYTLAMLAFWTERASNAENLWMIAYLFLSGLVAPLELFPDAVRTFAMATPFPYLIYFPTTILLGDDAELVRGLLIMAAWGVGFFVLNRVLWRLGLRHYSAMGA